MKKVFIFLFFIFILMGCKNSNKLKYPETKKVDTTDVYFGVEVNDPYRWLEDPESEETKEWIKAQNKLTFSYLEKIPYRGKIKERLTEIYDYPRMSAIVKKGGKYLFFKNEGLQNQNILYIQDSLQEEPRILVDPNKLSDKGITAIGEYDVSKDGKYIVYSIATGGSDWREVFIKNIEEDKNLPETITRVKFSELSWYKDGFFYCSYPQQSESEALKNQRVYFHRINTPQSEDVLIFENPESPDMIYTAHVTDDEKYLVIYEAESTYGSKVYIKDLTVEGSGFLSLSESFDFENKVVGNTGNHIYLLTNDHAPMFKIEVIEVTGAGKYTRKDFIPAGRNKLEFASLAGEKMVVKYLVDAHAEVRMFDLNGKYLNDLTLPGLGDLNEFNGKYGDNEAFYSFETYTFPPVIFRYNADKNESDQIFKPETRFNPEDFTTELKFYKSKDGTTVPLYLVHKKGLQRNGKNHILLYGYGGFNISLTPWFTPYVVLWLESGGIYAVANIRGGGEYGEEWHQAGTKLKKQNVFDDFIAAAEYLISEKYTVPEKLAIEGRSNGGLLVGAVTNQRPDLFGVALPGVGVMDMLRFSKFTIGWAWESDYGSVNDPEEFRNLLAISPLHNIKPDDYPAVLVTTADMDDRVVPAHSFKYISTLQAKQTGEKPVLIRIQTEAGHGAGKPVLVLIDERADIMSFTFYNLETQPF